MEKTGYRPGTPSWVDLGSPDPAAAAAFYGGLFGWTCEAGPPETGGYRICLLRGRPVAGIGTAQLSGKPFWTTYVSVTDVDTAAKAVRDNGGIVLVPTIDILSAGRMSVVADPTGATFSLWQPRDHVGAGLVQEPGTLAWNELATRDPDAATRFYPAVFDWVPRTEPLDGVDYTVWTLAGEQVGGMIRMDDHWPAGVPAHWMVYFAVDDTDATAALATELGGAVVVAPTDIAVGRFAVLNDPHGAAFSVIALHPG